MATADSGRTLLRQAHLPTQWTMADLQAHLGGIPANRIRLYPPPGYATEADVLEIEDREDRLCELEDGILVEKPMGWYESILAILVAYKISSYLEDYDLGQVLGADGSLKILPRTIKIPDVSFVSWARFPKERLGRRPIPELIPDLVVEVLSDPNTKKEMAMKLDRYFKAGVKLVWYIDPESRSATAFTSPNEFVHVEESGELDGGDVLPGFGLTLTWLFERADRQSGPTVD